MACLKHDIELLFYFYFTFIYFNPKMVNNVADKGKGPAKKIHTRFSAHAVSMTSPKGIPQGFPQVRRALFNLLTLKMDKYCSRTGINL